MPLFRFLILFGLFSSAVCAESDDDSNEWWKWGGQTTWIFQQNTPVPGEHFNPEVSFGPETNFGWSGTLSISASIYPWKGGVFFMQPEYANSHGMPNVSGLSGYPNGDSIRTGVLGTNPAPYMGRFYYSQDFGFGNISIGKFALGDFFDASQIANDPRRHFMNWALMEQGAWDYAADTRGYTYGFILKLENERFALRTGVALMPEVANGVNLSWDIANTRSEMAEGSWKYQIAERAGSAKLLLYMNHADMGTYDRATDDITATRRPGTIKYGAGVLVEQELTSALNAFMRVGANDGQTESYAFTEIDQSFSTGVDLIGSLWKRPEDHLALGVAVSGLSRAHAAYLARGGKGFQLGDGSLDYAPETIMELYYRFVLSEQFEVSADVQGILNPGMNAEHGPVAVFGMRFHAHYD